jgi:hypothetical protein
LHRYSICGTVASTTSRSRYDKSNDPLAANLEENRRGNLPTFPIFLPPFSHARLDEWPGFATCCGNLLLMLSRTGHRASRSMLTKYKFMNVIFVFIFLLQLQVVNNFGERPQSFNVKQKEKRMK